MGNACCCCYDDTTSSSNTGAPSTQPQQPSTAPQGQSSMGVTGKFYIRNVNSNMSLEAKANSVQIPPWIWSFHGENNQQWQLTKGSSDATSITSFLNTGKALQIQQDSSILFTDTSAQDPQQKWYLVPLSKVNPSEASKLPRGNDTYFIVSANGWTPGNSYDSMTVLTVKNSSLTSGETLRAEKKFAPTATVKQFRSQLWYIDPVTPENKEKFLFYYYDPKKTNELNEEEQSLEITSSWNDAIPAMFFAWAVYEHFIDPSRKENPAALNTGISAWMIGKRYSATPLSSPGNIHQIMDTRLNGYGTWYLRNEYHYEYDVYNTHAIIAECLQRKVIVVSFSGTESEFSSDPRRELSIRDWYNNDFNIDMMPFDPKDAEKGLVHCGFTKAYLVIREAIMKQIKLYFDAGYKIIVTGHSKGGAMTVLNTIDIYDRLKIGTTGTPDVIAHPFGGPRVGNAKFRQYFESRVDKTKYLAYVAAMVEKKSIIEDIVSKVPGSGTNLITPGSKHDYVHMFADNVKYIVANPSYFGNPKIIPEVNVDYRGLGEVKVKIGVNLDVHWQQVYMDGLLTEKLLDTTDEGREESSLKNAIEEATFSATVFAILLGQGVVPEAKESKGCQIQ